MLQTVVRNLAVRDGVYSASSISLPCETEIGVEKALKMANIAEDYQKSLSTEMKTIHSVKKVLGTSETGVTIEALDSITHTPAVIIRKIN